jgi:predicted XRE-type DNA-binding protein
MVRFKPKMTYEANHANLCNARPNEEKIELGSGNVFADLGFRNAEARLLKTKLATEIAQSIEKKGWSQAQTAERTGLHQSRISRLLRGQLSGFSVDELFAILNRLEPLG